MTNMLLLPCIDLLKKWENMIKCTLLKWAVFGLFFLQKTKQIIGPKKSTYAHGH